MHVFFAPFGSLSFHKTTSCSDYNGGRLIWVQHKVAEKRKQKHTAQLCTLQRHGRCKYKPFTEHNETSGWNYKET